MPRPADGQNGVVQHDRGAYNVQVRPLTREKVWGRSCATSTGAAPNYVAVATIVWNEIIIHSHHIGKSVSAS